MSDEDIRGAVLGVLRRIAPEADAAALAPDADLRRELDLDSMDFLEFATGISRVLGVTVPERDYSRLATLGGAVEYLRPKVAAGATR